jgi:hypothetical protein
LVPFVGNDSDIRFKLEWLEDVARAISGGVVDNHHLSVQCDSLAVTVSIADLDLELDRAHSADDLGYGS